MMHVKDLMTTKVLTLKDSDTLHDARQLMEKARIRHLPVLDARGAFRGLVTHRDLLSYTVSQLAGIRPEERAEIESGLPISEIMRTDVVTATPGTSLRDAAEILYTQKYGCLPVLEVRKEGHRLTGIVTESDFVRLSIVLLQG